jgi:hypothetical protein
MRRDEEDPRRCVPVRLCDIDPVRRLRAAVVCCKEARDEGEKLDLIAAAMNPSETVYWVAPGAEAAA